MTTMLEKMARAICEANGDDPDAETMDAGRSSPMWKHYVIDAAAALKVIRVPTEAMTDAFYKHQLLDGVSYSPDHYLLDEEAYTAMIDAILEEKTS